SGASARRRSAPASAVADPAAEAPAAVSCECLRLDLGEERSGRVLQRPRLDRRSGGTGPLEQGAITPEGCKAEVGETRLARAEQRAASAQLEIDLRELEAVARVAERLQTRVRRIGQLLLRPRDEQAIRLLGAAPDAAAQLVELREAESVGLLD